MTNSTASSSTLTREANRPDARTIVDRIPSWVLLLAATVLAAVTGPRWPIPALAWIAPVPYLLFARRARGWRAWLGLAGVQIAAGCLQLLTIVTPPVPWYALIGFGPPLGVIWFTTTFAAEQLRRRIGETAGALGFAAGVAVMGWIGYGVTELGAWMAMANNQVDELRLLQLASIGGLAGLGFMMAWFAGSAAMLLGAPRGARRWKPVIALGAVLGLGLGWATLRVDDQIGGRHVVVAAVTTDLGMTERGLPDAAALALNTDELFARTRVAATRGARLVVWNEVATVIAPADEPGFVARGQAMARELGIDLVLAYAVLVTSDPILLDNKYTFIADDGLILDVYRKHHPVPGEPSIRGDGPLRILDRPYGKVGGAICYDYDFPAMAREHALAGAELVVIPASDWRGIDPNHTGMARIRAIEGGFSILRSTRWGATAAIDGHGRIRGWMTPSQPDHVMVATLPVGQIATVATAIGDLPVALAGATLAGLIAVAVIRRRRRRAC